MKELKKGVIKLDLHCDTKHGVTILNHIQVSELITIRRDGSICEGKEESEVDEKLMAQQHDKI